MTSRDYNPAKVGCPILIEEFDNTKLCGIIAHCFKVCPTIGGHVRYI
jgi:hypothetical protein